MQNFFTFIRFTIGHQSGSNSAEMPRRNSGIIYPDLINNKTISNGAFSSKDYKRMPADKYSDGVENPAYYNVSNKSPSPNGDPNTFHTVRLD